MTTQDLAQKEPSKQSAMRDFLASKMPAMQAVATKHLNPEKLVKVIGLAMSRTPNLLDCTPISVLNAAMTLTELGLAPSGPLGTAYLIPYGKECQLIIGYRGMVELARRSGQISTIEAEVVREGDDFELEYGITPKFRHIPKGDTSQPIVRVWAMARFKDGAHQLAVLSIDEVDAIRKRSRASKNGPWVTDYAEMVKKTAVRRLCKMLPLTPEIEAALEAADRTEFDFGEMPSAATTGAKGLAARIGLDDDEGSRMVEVELPLEDPDDDRPAF